MDLQFLILIISTFLILFMMLYINNINKNKKTQISRCFSYVLICIFIISFGVIIQAIASNILNIDPLYFEYIIYIGTCFLPVAFFFTAMSYLNTKLTFKNSYLLLFVTNYYIINVIH